MYKQTAITLIGLLFPFLTLLCPAVAYDAGQITSPKAGSKPVSDNSGAFQVADKDVYVFRSKSAPPATTPAPQLMPAKWEDYRRPGGGRLGILLTDANSAWLALAHGLKSFGIPFTITTDWQEALQQPVVMVYPSISGQNLPKEALQALARFPLHGGTLIGSQVLGGGMGEVFGFREAFSSRNHQSVEFVARYASILDGLNDPSERKISISGLRNGSGDVGTVSYQTDIKHKPLAVYEDGTAMLTHKSYGKGQTYAWGLDIGHLLYQGYSGRGEGIARSYINEFEPSIDVVMRTLESIYRQGNDNAVTLWPVPENKSLAVIVTHDVDFGKSQENAVLYAQAESKQGIKSTYFWQTKYIRDYYDDMFFDDTALSYLKSISDMGMEIGSHSVAHSYAFSEFPLGSGTEAYPAYRPYISSRILCHNGTLLGELRVSKYLLEQAGQANTVQSFRPGHLTNPWALPQALRATGYKYTSTLTANMALTHLPFQLTFNRELDGSEPVFEFPVTVEDELPPRMDLRLKSSVELARKIARHGGSFVILIHPNITDYKLDFEQKFIDQVKPWSWFGTLQEYGSWWAARNQVQTEVTAKGSERWVTLETPVPITGLTLRVPRNWRLEGSGDAKQEGDRVVLLSTTGTINLKFSQK